ncbi:uncharacterized protein LOC124933702 [Impatiens glandulifera]|uniref:uncharacterized protein LOC124933702 n=1 Tax=Impatiens glandulifera TaxID=253017 RepID=UPI001FB0B897|nr:uncharacterized protein LOC124933702 [Impatiens glandulifera]
MGILLLLHDGRLSIILSLVFLFWLLPNLRGQPQPPNSSPGSQMILDALLQDYAYQALVHPKTGIAYEGTVPSNLTGIQVSGMRVRRGSLRARGIKTYKEFEIPMGLIVQPNVERLVLVYQNLGNWSASYYSLSGYTNLTPVLGLLSYDASNLSAKNLPELNLMAAGQQPITIRFSEVGSVPQGSVSMCVWFDLQGLVTFSNVVSGGCVLLVLTASMGVWVRNYRRKKKMRGMERAAEVGESLSMKTVGNVKAPAAMGTRTQPAIEHEAYPS